MTRRHIDRWRGLHCFTVRLLQMMGALPGHNDLAVRHGCLLVHQWWQTEGRYLSHFRLREANRLTAYVPLVYTNLPEGHPVHEHVLGRCRQQAQQPTPATSTTDTAAGLLLRRVVVPASPPETSSPDDDTVAPHPAEVWRRFVHRFPVLAVYQPAWNPEWAAVVLDSCACLSNDEAAVVEQFSRGLETPLSMDHVRQLAEVLHSQGKQLCGGRWRTVSRVALCEAAMLLRGFGEHAGAVMEAVRLAQRSTGGLELAAMATD